MAIPDATTVAQRWAQGAANAATRYADGVATSDIDPTARAIANGQRYLQRVQQSFNDGTWANALRRSGKQGWQAGVATKGVQNYSTGVQQAEGKFRDRIAAVLAYEATLQNTINNMPNTTDAEREARMLAWVRGMRQFNG